MDFVYSFAQFRLTVIVWVVVGFLLENVAVKVVCRSYFKLRDWNRLIEQLSVNRDAGFFARAAFKLKDGARNLNICIC